MKRILLLALLASSAMAQEPTVAEFKKASLDITVGTSEKQIISRLGEPSQIQPPSWKDVRALKAEKGLEYRHPDWATVFMLIGIKAGKVTGVQICRATGSQAWTTECQLPAEYWAKAE